MIAPGRHGAGIRIGQRHLLIGSRLQLPTNLLQFSEAPAQRRQSLGEVLDARRGRAGLGAAGFFKLGKVPRDALLDMGLPARQFALGYSSLPLV